MGPTVPSRSTLTVLGEAFSTHLAGIPAHDVVKAVEDYCLGIQLASEEFE